MYRTIGVLSIVLAMTASAFAGPAITTGLMAYYSFDSGVNLAADTSGHNFNGTVSNSVGVTSVLGKLGGAASFANVYTSGPAPTNATAPDFINLPGAAMNPSGLNAFSFAGWFKPSYADQGTNWMILSGSDATKPGTPVTQFRIRTDGIDRTELRLRTIVDPNTATTFVDQSVSDPSPSTEWIHLAFTYDKAANAYSIYANGVNVNQGAPTSALTIGAWNAPDAVWNAVNGQYTHSLRLGAAANDQTNGFGGLMDEVYLFNQSLTANQISTLYNDSFLQGDANRDGKTDATDLNTVLSFYNQSGKGWTGGDFNGDGKTDATDLNTVLSYYNQSLGGNLQMTSNAVPEPSSIAMLATLLAVWNTWMIRRRRS